MSKAILLSIRPEWVDKILTGEKTIEVRKKFPKDFRGWVYIYCTKSKDKKYEYKYHGIKVDGKVVARFSCDIVGTIMANELCSDKADYILKDTCLAKEQVKTYSKDKLYLIYVSQLEIFNKPKELSEFSLYRCNTCDLTICSYCDTHLTKAPQNYLYIKENNDEKH